MSTNETIAEFRAMLVMLGGRELVSEDAIEGGMTRRISIMAPFLLGLVDELSAARARKTALTERAMTEITPKLIADWQRRGLVPTEATIALGDALEAARAQVAALTAERDLAIGDKIIVARRVDVLVEALKAVGGLALLYGETELLARIDTAIKQAEGR